MATLLHYPSIVSIIDNLEYEDLRALREANINDDVTKLAFRKQQQMLEFCVEVIALPDRRLMRINTKIHTAGEIPTPANEYEAANIDVELPRSFSFHGYPTQLDEGTGCGLEKVKPLLNPQNTVNELNLHGINARFPLLPEIELLSPRELNLWNISDPEMKRSVRKLLAKGTIKKLVITNCVDFENVVLEFVEQSSQLGRDRLGLADIEDPCDFMKKIKKIWEKKDALPGHFQAITISENVDEETDETTEEQHDIELGSFTHPTIKEREIHFDFDCLFSCRQFMIHFWSK